MIVIKKECTSPGGYGSRRQFKAETSRPPTLDEITRMQSDLGFWPGGYGTPGNIQRTTRSGIEGSNLVIHITTWECAHSCD